MSHTTPVLTLKALSLLLAILFGGVASLAAEPKPPNVVVFLVDDLGYMDIGANNPNTFYETPNVDKLAASGMRFTDGYAANPVCSPTRYSLMTGKYPTPAGCTDWFTGMLSCRFGWLPISTAVTCGPVLSWPVTCIRDELH